MVGQLDLMVANECAAWCYIISNMNNQLLSTCQMEKSERTNLGHLKSD
jgi:hypothetical protein